MQQYLWDPSGRSFSLRITQSKRSSYSLSPILPLWGGLGNDGKAELWPKNLPVFEMPRRDGYRACPYRHAVGLSVGGLPCRCWPSRACAAMAPHGGKTAGPTTLIYPPAGKFSNAMEPFAKIQCRDAARRSAGGRRISGHVIGCGGPTPFGKLSRLQTEEGQKTK